MDRETFRFTAAFVLSLAIMLVYLGSSVTGFVTGTSPGYMSFEREGKTALNMLIILAMVGIAVAFYSRKS